MKKILFLFALLFLLPAATHAEVIRSFDVTIMIQEDSSIIVEEKILYDFETARRHGIYRDVTKDYKARGGNFSLRIRDIEVTDEAGKSWNFETSNYGEYLRIKIGDADTYVTGERVYSIRYKVERAVNFFDTHDELYWNATGDEWTVLIENATATVHFSNGDKMQDIQIECFAGRSGSTRVCDEQVIQRNSVFFAQSFSQVHEGLTLVVGFPKGIIETPTWKENLIWFFQDNWGSAIFPVTLVILFLFWLSFGRDPRDDQTIIAQFDAPDNLSPAEMGTITDERVDDRDISATLIDLAIRGYMKIHKEKNVGIFVKEDYTFEKQKEFDEELRPFEKQLLEKFFENKSTIKLSSLKNSFKAKSDAIKNEIYHNVSIQSYFVKDPSAVRNRWRGFGMAILVSLFILGGVLDSLIIVASAFLSGFAVILFGGIMPARTLRGVKAYKHILGLKRYIEVAEKDRINFHNAPEKTPELFEKLLPYAIVLGIEEKWAQEFEDIYTRQPSWYDGSINSFHATSLVSSLNSFTQATNTTLSSQASSGGSGFSGGSSGGGGGGGGGGSW